MSIEFTIRKGTTNPTSGSGITLGEPAFNYSNNTLWIGKGYGVTAAWVGAGICGASAGIAAGLTYEIPTLGAVKDYISSIGTIGATGATGATGPVGDYVVSFNGITGAISFANYAASVNGLTGAIIGVGFTSGKLSQFASTTSAELAGVISDETGSGVLVFGTSPSITTSLNTVSPSFNLLTTNATTLSIGNAATTGRLFGYTGTLTGTQSVTIAGANTDSSVNKTVSIGTGSGTSGTVTLNLGQTPTEGSGAINLLSNTAVTGTLSTTGNITAPNIVTSFNGITGAVTGVTAGGANTFTQLNSFSAGISAAGGATFSGTFSGTTGSFSKLLTLSGGLSASGATFSGSIGLQNAEFIRNTTNGRVDIMPAPAVATAYGMYFDMTSWTYGVILGTIRSSDGAINTGGNFRVDVPLTINDNTLFQMGSDGHYGLYRSTTGLDTLQIKATINNAADSGAVAVVGGNDLGAANRSPGISHSNPNLYVYRAGSASANDFIRTEHNGTNANIVSGGTSGILIQPGSGVLGISGDISAGTGTFSSGISTVGTVVANAGVLADSILPLAGSEGSGTLYINSNSGAGSGGAITHIGDLVGDGNNTFLTVDDDTASITINANSVITLGGPVAASSTVSIGSGVIDQGSVSASTTSTTITTLISGLPYSSVKFFIQARNTTTGTYQITEIVATKNALTTVVTSTPVNTNTGGVAAVYTVDISGVNNAFRLRATSTAASETVFTVFYTGIP